MVFITHNLTQSQEIFDVTVAMEYFESLKIVTIASKPEEYAKQKCPQLLDILNKYRNSTTNSIDNTGLNNSTYSVIDQKAECEETLHGEDNYDENQPLISSAISNHEDSMNPVTIVDGLVLASIQEEVFWDIGITGRRETIADSKIFFFASLLWRLTFGLSTDNGNKCYYIYLSPGEKLKNDCRLRCEFRLRRGEAVHSRTNDHDYIFPKFDSSSRQGFDRFIDQGKLDEFTTLDGKLLLSVVLSTDVSAAGELLGCDHYSVI